MVLITSQNTEEAAYSPGTLLLSYVLPPCSVDLLRTHARLSLRPTERTILLTIILLPCQRMCFPVVASLHLPSSSVCAELCPVPRASPHGDATACIVGPCSSQMRPVNCLSRFTPQSSRQYAALSSLWCYSGATGYSRLERTEEKVYILARCSPPSLQPSSRRA
ncbi:hypothetical protein PYCCODRAFT_910844 [Trametes coccinea BRFM310]|uniref:Uncharacterized protein n=1 Tax=Trametes coccinea (strain BRFM310) TaxID=1353009 RepID=A0A1Y2ICA2_TRAC3|nr:hypothetical protein PYCCODRAFT_910844 [Trametes coccinea BRFM310]